MRVVLILGYGVQPAATLREAADEMMVYAKTQDDPATRHVSGYPIGLPKFRESDAEMRNEVHSLDRNYAFDNNEGCWAGESGGEHAAVQTLRAERK